MADNTDYGWLRKKISENLQNQDSTTVIYALLTLFIIIKVVLKVVSIGQTFQGGKRRTADCHDHEEAYVSNILISKLTKIIKEDDENDRYLQEKIRLMEKMLDRHEDMLKRMMNQISNMKPSLGQPKEQDSIQQKNTDFPILKRSEYKELKSGMNLEKDRTKSKNQNLDLNKQGADENENRRPIPTNQRDRKRAEKSDVRENEKAQNYDDQHTQDIPNVLFIHDSIFKYVDQSRLNKGYGVNAKKRLAYKIEDIKKVIDEECSESHKFEAVFVHSGINNLRNEDPKTAATKMTKVINEISLAHPNVKIIVSRTAPTSIPDMENKRGIFNSMLVSNLYGKKNVILICHENLRRGFLRDDGIHPLIPGTTILAKNTGRCLRALFWNPGSKGARKWQQQWWAENITSY